VGDVATDVKKSSPPAFLLFCLHSRFQNSFISLAPSAIHPFPRYVSSFLTFGSIHHSFKHCIHRGFLLLDLPSLYPQSWRFAVPPASEAIRRHQRWEPLSAIETRLKLSEPSTTVPEARVPLRPIVLTTLASHYRNRSLNLRHSMTTPTKITAKTPQTKTGARRERSFPL
jgi:hypothetical protein